MSSPEPEPRTIAHDPTASGCPDARWARGLGTLRVPMAFIPPMLCSSLRDLSRLGDPRYAAEPKLDGSGLRFTSPRARRWPHSVGLATRP